MTTIVEFLTARLDDAESAILDGWDSDGKARVAAMQTGPEPGHVTIASDHGDGEWFADGREVTDARYVRVLFDPKTVLADIAAKRKILAEHQPDGYYVYLDDGTPACATCGDHTTMWPCSTLRLLALPFDQRPDYDEIWRP